MDSTPLISLIVPVYNVEKYLGHCIESVIMQTYDNIEIILVDDGSTDGSGAICDHYSAIDNRVVVFHTENHGQSHARNIGLDNANGELIAFVDSDDTVSPNYIGHLYRLLTENSADISTTRLYDFCRISQLFIPKQLLLSGTESLRSMLYQHIIESCAVCKLFRKELFDGIRFSEGLIYEDLELLPRILSKAKKVVWSNDRQYSYTKRPDSTTRAFSEKRLDVLKVTTSIAERMETEHPELLPAAYDRMLSANFNMFQLLVRNGMAKSESASKCYDTIKRLRFGRLTDRHVRLKNKVGIIMSYFGRSFLTALCRMV